MAEIEASCARLAALSMTPIERRRLQSRHEAMAELVLRDDREAYAAAKIDFHTHIYLGAHNAIVSQFAQGLRRRLAPFRRAQFRTEGRRSRGDVSSHEPGRKFVRPIGCRRAGQGLAREGPTHA